MNNRVNFDLIPFSPAQWSGDVFQLAQLIAEHLQGDLDNSVFEGQNGGTEPTSDVGLWLNEDVWERWDPDAAKYVPLKVMAGVVTNGNLHTATFSATNTDKDVNFNLPGESGDLALKSDILSTGEIGTQSGTAIFLDYTRAKVYAVITGNATVSEINERDGKSVELFVETPIGHGTALTITFPSYWHIGTGGQILGTTDATHRSVTKFLIQRVGIYTFVTKMDTWSIDQNASGGDGTKPTFDSARIDGGTTLLHVIFSEPVIGITTPAKWIVKKAGVTQTIDSIAVNGLEAQITLANPVSSGVSITVQYTGTDQVKDVAGNFADPFPPKNVEVLG